MIRIIRSKVKNFSGVGLKPLRQFDQHVGTTGHFFYLGKSSPKVTFVQSRSSWIQQLIAPIALSGDTLLVSAPKS
jgi:hypothetical protein